MNKTTESSKTTSSLLLTLLASLFCLSSCFPGVFDSDDDNSASIVKWESLNYDSYEFEQRFLCFCVEPAGRFQRILVRNNAIISITDIASSDTLTVNKYQFFKTVPQLLEFVNSIDPDSVAVFRVSYDETYGYPTDIYLDYNAGIADEEIGYESRNLRPMQ